MKRGDLVAFGTSAVNGFLNGAFGGPPADETDGGIGIAVTFGLRKLRGGGSWDSAWGAKRRWTVAT